MVTSAEQEALDCFGALLIECVREKAIQDWTKILDGRMKGETAEHLRPDVSRLEPGELVFIQRLVPMIVDTTLHHLLWTLEQEPSVDIAVRTQRTVVPSLRDISDGLAGELYRWIPRFSESGED